MTSRLITGGSGTVLSGVDDCPPGCGVVRKLVLSAVWRSWCMLMLAQAVSAPAGQPQTIPARPPQTQGRRYLLVIESSKAMQKRIPATAKAVSTMLEDGLRG